MMVMHDIRPSPIAGHWYPGHKKNLADTIDWLIDHAEEHDIPGRILGLVAPHAGYRYSGSTAAQAFKLIAGMTFDRVVVISPMHRYHPSPVLTTGHHAYATPLGTIPVDLESIASLQKALTWDVVAVREDTEHSLEIELPFLQRVVSGDFKLVPLMLRGQTVALAEELGKALAQVLDDGKSSLLVASSDLSHQYPEAVARKLDEVMLDQIKAFDPAAVIRVEDEGKAFACGRAAIASMLFAAREIGATHTKIVGYTTSAEATRDFQNVVGYGAAVVYREA